MRIFGRRRKPGGRLPTYSNASVIAAIERDNGVDRATARAWFAEMLVCRERFGRVIHHEPTDRANPEAYHRAYDRRTRLGSFDSAVWAPPVVSGAAASEAVDFAGDGGSGFGGWDWGGGSDGGGGGCGGSDGGGGGCGGGGGG